jgi:hypothetical protein
VDWKDLEDAWLWEEGEGGEGEEEGEADSSGCVLVQFWMLEWTLSLSRCIPHSRLMPMSTFMLFLFNST